MSDLQENRAEALDDREAESDIKKAVGAIIFSASVTTLFGVLGFFFTDVGGSLGGYIDPWGLVDAAILWILALFIWRRSFPAFVILNIYWIFNIFVVLVSMTNLGGLLIKGLFLFWFIKGAIAAWRINKTKPPHDRSTLARIAIWSFGIVGGGVVLALCVMGLLATMGIMPTDDVLDRDSITSTQVRKLEELGILRQEETVELFYAGGVWSIEEDGNLITDQRVISYWRNDEGELRMNAVEHGEISGVEIMAQDDDASVSVLRVSLDEGDGFMLIVTTKDDGHERFIEAIRQKL